MRLSLSPDLLFFNRQSAATSDIRARLQTASFEATTGRREDIRGALSGRVGEGHLIGKAGRDVARAQELANLAGVRLDGVSSAIENIREAAAPLQTKAIIAFESASASVRTAFVTEAEDGLKAVMDQLRSKQGSRSLFSGDDSRATALASTDQLQTDITNLITNAPDFAAADAALTSYFNDAGGGFDNIYQGGANDGPRLWIDADTSVPSAPKANAQVFKDMMRGISTLIASESHPDPTVREELVANGLSILGGSMGDLNKLEAKIGAQAQGVGETTERLGSEASILADMENRLLGRDSFEATTELLALESQLQTSYTVTGRIAGLGLVNFLR